MQRQKGIWGPLAFIKESMTLKLSILYYLLEHEIFLLINVKMPTIGILTFTWAGKIAFSAYLSLNNVEFLDIFILMSIWNFMLSWAEHQKSFITSGLVCNAKTRETLKTLHFTFSWYHICRATIYSQTSEMQT